jgi:hypothetical protein
LRAPPIRLYQFPHVLALKQEGMNLITKPTLIASKLMSMTTVILNSTQSMVIFQNMKLLLSRNWVKYL